MVIDGKSLTKFILYFSMVHIGISYSSFIVLPNFLLYSIDLACILLIVLIIRKMKHGIVFSTPGIRRLTVLIVCIVIYAILTGFFNCVNPVWLIRGIRGALRFYVLVVGMILFWTPNDVDQFFNCMDKLYWINFLFVLIQKIRFGNINDLIIGITGTYLAVYMAFMFAYKLLCYMNKKTSLKSLIVVIIINFIIAVWGDQRGYYFMFVAVLVGLVLLEQMSLKKIVTIVLGVTVLIVGWGVISRISPTSLMTITSIDSILEYGYSTTGGYEISRFGAFKEINDLFFHGDIFRNLFGYGLGYCEVESPFYNVYGYLHYTWFAHQWTFLEQGYIGIILMIVFFIFIIIITKANLKICTSVDFKIKMECSAIISIIAIITTIYFSMLRSNSGFFLYGIVAMSMVLIQRMNLEKEII